MNHTSIFDEAMNRLYGLINSLSVETAAREWMTSLCSWRVNFSFYFSGTASPPFIFQARFQEILPMLIIKFAFYKGNVWDVTVNLRWARNAIKERRPLKIVLRTFELLTMLDCPDKFSRFTEFNVGISIADDMVMKWGFYSFWRSGECIFGILFI